MDDKGCVFIAMWGVPDFSYSNNCARALYCAAAIHKLAAAMDFVFSIGLTTGMVYCRYVPILIALLRFLGFHTNSISSLRLHLTSISTLVSSVPPSGRTMWVLVPTSIWLRD